MLDETRDGMSTKAMIKAIRALPKQGRPSQSGAQGLLDGLEVVKSRVTALLDGETA
jgi:hypothetical protein